MNSFQHGAATSQPAQTAPVHLSWQIVVVNGNTGVVDQFAEFAPLDQVSEMASQSTVYMLS